MPDGASYHFLVDRLYQASAEPGLWPVVLEEIGHYHGAKGANLIHGTAAGLKLIPSPGVAQASLDFEREGWNRQNSRVERLMARADHGGFLTDSHLHSAHELETLPIYVSFLNPRGGAAGAATVIQGPNDDAMVVAIEGFPDHEASRLAVPSLDRLRPDLARAVAISSQIEAVQARSILEAFDAVGVALALLDQRGLIVGATARFKDAGAGLLAPGLALQATDTGSNRRLAKALAALVGTGAGASVALRDEAGHGRGALHLVPARARSGNIFSKVHAYALLAKPQSDAMPSSDIIGALFDLTAAEARVARGIAMGRSPTELAKEAQTSVETIRSQLKSVFQKTSVARQSELAVLVSALGGMTP